MFDLEQSIAEWRQRMLATGIRTPVPLEELESHLREELERQKQLGLVDRQAFELATQQIGQARALRSEFEKNDTSIGARFVELAGIAWGVIAGLFSLWILLVLLAIHEANWAGRMLGLVAVAATVFSWRYGYRLLPVIRHRLVRTFIGFAGCVASVVWMGIFVKLILPPLIEQVEIFPGRLMVSFLWAWTVAAALASLAHGLKEVACRQDPPVIS
ncbi:MAG: hypothetical protein WAO02_08480 [Verrucomicrobiia bacterium]